MSLPRPDDPPPTADSATHVDDAARAIAQLLIQHEEAATRPERILERLTAAMGSVRFVLGFTAVIGLWIGLNLRGARWAGV